MDKCREEFEKWFHTNEDDSAELAFCKNYRGSPMENMAIMAQAWFAAWNARQPEKPTPDAEVPIPTVDFFEVAGEWSVKEGFTTWYEEHGAVVRNFCRYLTKSRGGV